MSSKNWKSLCYICNSQTRTVLGLWKGNPHFRLRIRLHHLKFLVPAIQNCLGSGYRSAVIFVKKNVQWCTEKICSTFRKNTTVRLREKFKLFGNILTAKLIALCKPSCKRIADILKKLSSRVMNILTRVQS